MALAHPQHVSMSEVAYNAKTKSLEISIEVLEEDLESVLKRYSPKAHSKEKKEKALFSYVQKRLLLRFQNKSLAALSWVGMESQNQKTYLYLEFLVPKGIKNSSWKNHLFFDFHPDQRNRMILKINKKESNYIFYRGIGFQKIPSSRKNK